MIRSLRRFRSASALMLPLVVASGCAATTPVMPASTAKTAPVAAAAVANTVCPHCGLPLDSQGKHNLAGQADRVLGLLVQDAHYHNLPDNERQLYVAFIPKAMAKLDVDALLKSRVPGAKFHLASLGSQKEVEAYLATTARYVACEDPPPPPPPPPPVDPYVPPPPPPDPDPVVPVDPFFGLCCPADDYI